MSPQLLLDGLFLAGSVWTSSFCSCQSSCGLCYGDPQVGCRQFMTMARKMMQTCQLMEVFKEGRVCQKAALSEKELSCKKRMTWTDETRQK